MAFGFELACWLWLCTQEPAKTGQNLRALVGSDACRAELKGSGAEYGLALDRKQRADFDVREINGRPTLLLIQDANNSDHCGTVRDIVAAPSAKDAFEFECIDHADASRVVF